MQYPVYYTVQLCEINDGIIQLLLHCNNEEEEEKKKNLIELWNEMSVCRFFSPYCFCHLQYDVLENVILRDYSLFTRSNISRFKHNALLVELKGEFFFIYWLSFFWNWKKLFGILIKCRWKITLKWPKVESSSFIVESRGKFIDFKNFRNFLFW